MQKSPSSSCVHVFYSLRFKAAITIFMEWAVGKKSFKRKGDIYLHTRADRGKYCYLFVDVPRSSNTDVLGFPGCQQSIWPIRSFLQIAPLKKERNQNNTKWVNQSGSDCVLKLKIEGRCLWLLSVSLLDMDHNEFYVSNFALPFLFQSGCFFH